MTSPSVHQRFPACMLVPQLVELRGQFLRDRVWEAKPSLVVLYHNEMSVRRPPLPVLLDRGDAP